MKPKATLAELQALMLVHIDMFMGMKRVSWFYEWLKTNMHIYHTFEDYTWEHKLRMSKHYFSARAIIEIMRWNTLSKDSTIDFKISDHCMPYLARLVMLRNPELEGMFRLNSPTETLDDIL